MKKQVYLEIFGRVQGVFFRAEACEKARELGITGWVCNRDTGGVEVLAQGEEEKLQPFLEWCKKGPQGAKVTGVKVQLQDIKKEFERFEIQH